MTAGCLVAARRFSLFLGQGSVMLNFIKLSACSQERYWKLVEVVYARRKQARAETGEGETED